MLAVRLPESIERRLDALAEKTGRTKTFYVREAVLQHISDMEDLYLAHHIKERIGNAEERTYTLDEVIKDLGFEKKELARRTVRNRTKTVKKAR
jgi:RHH-type rel operon transcriptional repressor/antitoxin RelB